MTRRKLFSLIPAGLLTAIVPSFLKKKEIDPRSWIYPTVPSEPYTRTAWVKEEGKNYSTAWMEEITNDDTTGCWELCSIDKEGKVKYGLSDMRFRTLAEGWAWIDLLSVWEYIGVKDKKPWKVGLWHSKYSSGVLWKGNAHVGGEKVAGSQAMFRIYWEFKTEKEAEDFKASLRLLGNADKRIPSGADADSMLEEDLEKSANMNLIRNIDGKPKIF